MYIYDHTEKQRKLSRNGRFGDTVSYYIGEYEDGDCCVGSYLEVVY